jgi:flagellin
MTVSTIATIAAGLSRALNSPTNKAATALNSLIAQPNANAAKADVANFSEAITRQNQVAQFRVASKEVAQAGSLLSAAEVGANQIATNLTKLKDIATRATSTSLSDEARASLENEFQSVLAQIDAVAKNTKFNGESLLDGTSPQLKVTGEKVDQNSLSIGSLTTDRLFPPPRVSVLNPSGATITVDLVGKAIEFVTKQIENIQTLQQGLDFASVSLQSAIQNKDAANSTLNDADLVQALLGNGNANGNAKGTELFAQTNKLPNNLLQLLSE